MKKDSLTYFAPLFLAFLIISGGARTGHAADIPDQPEICNTPACQFKSRPEPWPKGSKTTTTPVQFGMFVVRIPFGWKRLAVGPDTLLKIDYGNYSVSLALRSYEALGKQARGIFKKSHYRLLDYARLLHGITPNDTPPSNPYDRQIWRMALKEKQVRFAGIKKVTVYRKGDWTAYVARIDFAGFTGDTIITHAHYPDFVLRILDQGAPPAFIEQLISGISLDKTFY